MPRVPSYRKHLELLYSCRACPTVVGIPITGAVAGARVMLVGQAPGPHEEDFGKPFAYTAGKRLFSWFEKYLSMDEATFRSRVYIGAVIRCFPGRDEKAGGDRVPSADEIARCSSHLERELEILRPGLVIAVGTLSAAQLVGIAQLKHAVGVPHRVTRAGVTFDVVVLPHPSGRSTWLNHPENHQLLLQSLALIERHPAWGGCSGRGMRT